MSSARPERSGSASGVNETLVEAAGALGIAVLGSVLVETGSFGWPLPVAAGVAIRRGGGRARPQTSASRAWIAGLADALTVSCVAQLRAGVPGSRAFRSWRATRFARRRSRVADARCWSVDDCHPGLFTFHGRRRPCRKAARALCRRRDRRTARHLPPQRSLPHELHRQRRDAAGHQRRARVHHRWSLPHAVGRAARCCRRRRDHRGGRHDLRAARGHCTRTRPVCARRTRSARGHVVTTTRFRRDICRARARRDRRSGGAPPSREGTGRGCPHPRRVRNRRRCARGDAAAASTTVRPSEFALELEVEMRRRGASGNSFDPIVASGPNAAKPHARPSARRIERAELVVIDFGCIVDGYCSDMTRTVSVGDPGADARTCGTSCARVNGPDVKPCAPASIARRSTVHVAR